MALRKKQLAAGTLLAIALILGAQPSVSAGKRVALVIGNSRYATAPLKNPANDAKLIKQVLGGLDFEVLAYNNLDLVKMEAALRTFRGRLKAGDLALFFFAGHGIQLKGQNYLVPIGVERIAAEYEVPHKMLNVGMVLEAMEDSDANLNVLVLDCCRNNPFQRSWRSVRSGLAAIADIPEGTLLAFATAPGTTAADGAGDNSPYTAELAQVLTERPQDGLELVDAFRRASQAVYKRSKQRPWINFDASMPECLLWAQGTSTASTNGPTKVMAKIEKTSPAERFDFSSARAGDVAEFTRFQINFCWCPPGTYKMGSPADDEQVPANEKPQIDVRLTSGFWLGQTEVTQAEWKAVMGTEPWTVDRPSGPRFYKEGPAFPATHIGWEDAVSFCKKLTDLERRDGRLTNGWEYQLPTEAQWEYACRAGTQTRYSFGDDPQDLDYYGWHYGNTGSAAPHEHPVGSKEPNPWNLHDMYGNVHEWCLDAYAHKVAGGSDPVRAPETGTPASRTYRVSRGCDWEANAEDCRSAARSGRPPSGGYYGHHGFRIALSRIRR